MDEARSASSRQAPGIQYKGGAGHVEQPVASNGADGGRVTIDPDMRVVPNPGFVAWREQLWREHGI